MTLRERDSTKQVRGTEEEVVKVVKGMCEGSESWADVKKKLPEFLGQSGED